MSEAKPDGTKEWGEYLDARHRLILALRGNGETCVAIAAKLTVDQAQVWMIAQQPPADRLGVAPAEDIAEACGKIEWSTEMPGRWCVEARATHIIVRTPGRAYGILTPQEAALLEAAVSTAKAIVHQAVSLAEYRKANMGAGGGGPLPPPSQG